MTNLKTFDKRPLHFVTFVFSDSFLTIIPLDSRGNLMNTKKQSHLL